MAERRRGKDAMRAAATRSSAGRFVPNHRFVAGETKYLQFLMSFDEITTVLFHRFICVGLREDGSKIYRDFVSPLDDSVDGPSGTDQLVERWGSHPSQRSIGLAIELEPIQEKKGSRKVIVGWEPVMRTYTDSEGEEKEVPNVALVIESPYTFYNHLGVVDDQTPIEETIISVTRTGKSTDTSYTILPVGEALSDDELEDMGVDAFFEEFDFEGYLDEISDKDEMNAILDELDDDFVVNPYAKKKGAKGKGGKSDKKEGSSTRTRRTRRVVEEPVDDGDDAEADEPEAESEEPEAEEKPTRKRRFNQLRSEVEG
jgi:hypothetical protein